MAVRRASPYFSYKNHRWHLTHVVGRHPGQAKNMGLRPEISSRDCSTQNLLHLDWQRYPHYQRFPFYWTWNKLARRWQIGALEEELLESVFKLSSSNRCSKLDTRYQQKRNINWNKSCRIRGFDSLSNARFEKSVARWWCGRETGSAEILIPVLLLITSISTASGSEQHMFKNRHVGVQERSTISLSCV